MNEFTICSVFSQLEASAHWQRGGGGDQQQPGGGLFRAQPADVEVSALFWVPMRYVPYPRVCRSAPSFTEPDSFCSFLHRTLRRPASRQSACSAWTSRCERQHRSGSQPDIPDHLLLSGSLLQCSSRADAALDAGTDSIGELRSFGVMTRLLLASAWMLLTLASLDFTLQCRSRRWCLGWASPRPRRSASCSWCGRPATATRDTRCSL